MTELIRTYSKKEYHRCRILIRAPQLAGVYIWNIMTIRHACRLMALAINIRLLNRMLYILI
jgi:hypothetical protein